MRRDDLDARFELHAASQLTRAGDHEQVREGCRLLAHGLNDLLPDGREKALAITNLEQVMFWANAALARQTDAHPAA